MAITLIANTFAQSPNANAVTTGGIDTTGATLLVVGFVFDKAAPTPGVSDSKSNTWVATTISPSGANNWNQCQIYYVKNPTVGAGHTFSAGGNGSAAAIFVAAFAGTDTTANVDQQNGAATGANVTTVQPGSVTPGVDNEVLITILGQGTAARTFSIDSSFTITDQAAFVGGQAYGGGLAYLIQAAAAAVNPTWTSSGNEASGLDAVINTFRAAAGGAVQQRLMLVGVGS